MPFDAYSISPVSASPGLAQMIRIIAPTSDPVFATLGGLEPRFGRCAHAVCKPCDRQEPEERREDRTDGPRLRRTRGSIGFQAIGSQGPLGEIPAIDYQHRSLLVACVLGHRRDLGGPKPPNPISVPRDIHANFCRPSDRRSRIQVGCFLR